MLCPEVWNFEAPHSSIKFNKGKTENVNFYQINNFCYNHMISVVVPDTLAVPEHITDKLLIDCDYYKITNVPVSQFVDKTFVDCFATKGSLIALSIITRIDCDNCVSITSSGVLVLSLRKESYQSLGIEGKVSHFYKDTKSRYIVKIDLKEMYLKKDCCKMKQKLSVLGNFTILLSWEPEDEEICPSSVAKYFHDLNYDVQLCTPKYETDDKYAVEVPDLNIPSFDEEDMSNFTEWLGMITLDGEVNSGKPDSFINTYETPDPKRHVGRVIHLLYKGFYTNRHIRSFMENIFKYIRRDGIPWAAIYVQGFSDSPVGRNGKENHFYTNGDHSFTYVFNDSHYFLAMQDCSFKRSK